MIKLGSHISFKAPNYLKGSLDNALKNKANTMMIYLGAPQNTKRVAIDKYYLNDYLLTKNAFPVKDIVIHAPYIINPASITKHKFAEYFLIEEIERMNFIGAKWLVLHPGSITTFAKTESIKTLVKVLQNIFKKTRKVHILLETMSGKGTELGSTFIELNKIITMVNSNRLGICLDTCHIWDAGYDITNYKEFIIELKKNNLLDLVAVIHINDSKNKLGSHKDRHENIGKGNIGLTALKRIVHGDEFKNSLKILETPFTNGVSQYKNEINLLK